MISSFRLIIKHNITFFKKLVCSILLLSIKLKCGVVKHILKNYY